MTTYLSFQMRCRAITRRVSHRFPFVDRGVISEYLVAFDDVLKSIGWSENDLLYQIDQNWES